MKISIGIGVNVLKNRGGFCSEYQTVYDALTTPPSASIAAAQNTMIKSLVAGGIWAKLDLFYLLAQTTNDDNEALINWINPGTFDATLVNAPAFVALEGFTGADTKYINTNWKPPTHGVNYTRFKASFGIYCRTDNSDSTSECGVIDTAEWIFLGVNIGGTTYARINSNLNSTSGGADSRGMWVVNRMDSSDQDVYRNGSRIIDDSTAVAAILPDYDMLVLARNNAGTPEKFSTKQLSLFFAGDGLTSGEITILTNAAETYMDSNGKGVIS